jgi:CYTH domain-containing protein
MGTGEAGRTSKYAQIERERRFLLPTVPAASEIVATRRIVDRYVTGTRLRLRHSQRLDTQESQYKFTQKIPVEPPELAQGWITTTYLTRAEYDLLAVLPAVTLTKTRLSVPPLGVDVFDGVLDGLILAEVEFDSDQDCHAFIAPDCCIGEVTADNRFTGGRLAQTSRPDLLTWLSDYNIALSPRN